MSDNAELIIRRGVLKGKLIRTINSNKVNAEDIEIAGIKVRRDKCEEVCREFEQTQLKIEEGAPELSEERKTYRSEFEDLYFQTVVECENIIDESNNITVLNNEYFTEDDRKIDSTRSSSSNMPKS